MTHEVNPGGRFLIAEPADAERREHDPPSIRVIKNWYEEFRDREQE